MAHSPQQEQQLRSARTELDRLRGAYRAVAGSLVLQDVLRYLDAGYKADHATAVAEQGNATRSAIYLQRADVYDTMRAYIRQMTDGN